MTIAAGTHLGSYELLAQIGAGGMGEVYKAHDTKLGRDVAIKVLPEAFAHDSERLARFQREAKMLAALNHPNIATIYGLEHSEGIHFLIMELVAGETLSERVKREGRIPVKEALKIAIQIADALRASHEKGIIHRDLKPANVKVTPEGRVKVLDFGLAKALVAGSAELDLSVAPTRTALNTEEGRILGTPAYMSPEQARGESVDERSDLFSLGAVLYEMATGRQPFAGSTSAVTFDAILNRQPQPAGEINPDLAEAFGILLGRLLAKKPLDRCQSAREVLEALEEIQGGRQAAPDGTGRAGRKIPSIAVLPFANLSPDPDNQYFSDGLSEDLISALARLEGLKVASRTSAFRFRGRDADIREIGRQLNVAAVLEGSVRRSGKRLRITAELVNVADGYHLWSERYDREIADIFEIQDEITGAIIKTLEPALAGQQASLKRRHSENLQAYELYLKGRRLWDQRGEIQLRAGLECFRAAIDLDSGYALAYCGVADSFAILGAHGYMPLSEGRPRAEAAVKKALELDSALSECHFSRGLATCVFGNRLADAEGHFRKAFEIQPQSSLNHAFLGLALATIHRFEDAIHFALKATELDPLSAFVHGVAGLTLQCSRASEEALRNASRALELQPNFVHGLWTRNIANGALGRWEEAIVAAERLVSVTRRSSIFVGQLGMTYGLAGQREKALALQQEAQQRALAGEYIGPSTFFAIDVGLNNLENAHAHLLEYLGDGGNGWQLEVAMGSFLDRLAANSPLADLFCRMGRAPVAKSVDEGS
jgi:serine/threonine protein kinase/Flp pilus assembly protein TadD